VSLNLVLGVICLIVVLIAGLVLMASYIADTDDMSDTNPGLVFGPFIQFFSWGVMTLLAVISLNRLNRTKIDKIGITLSELVLSLRPTIAKATSWFTTVLKSPKALRFMVIAVILFCTYSGIYIYLKSVLEELFEERTFSEPVAPELRFLKFAADLSLLGGWYFLLRARTKLQPTAESVLSMDRRAPVLFLRSFVDDERVRFLQAERTLFDFSLEARLATHFFKTGPFIAVDSPSHTGAGAIGAARASLPDTEWQGTVVGWMREARLIVLLAGLTKWVRWEMGKIVELGYSRKLIILMPELSRWKEFKIEANSWS
jgi:hypothetical protein